MVEPVVRTPQQIAQTEAVLQALIAKVPGLLNRYYGTGTKQSERELTDALSAIVRNENYTNTKLRAGLEGSPIDMKMLGQILNLPVSVHRNILGITDRGVFAYSTPDSGVDQAVYAFFSPTALVLDQEGKPAKMMPGERNEIPLAPEEEYDPDLIHLFQQMETPSTGNELSVHYDSDGFRALAEAVHSGRVISNEIDLGSFDYRESHIAKEGRATPVQAYIRTVRGERAIDSGAISKMIDALPHMKTHTLSLAGLTLTDSQFRDVLRAVEKNPYIKKLDLGTNRMDEQTVVVFRHFLKTNRSVTDITFSGEIPPMGFVRTLQTMSKHNHTIIKADFEGAGQAGQALQIPSYDGRGNKVLYEPRPMLDNIVWGNIAEAVMAAPNTPAAQTLNGYLAEVAVTASDSFTGKALRSHFTKAVNGLLSNKGKTPADEMQKRAGEILKDRLADAINTSDASVGRTLNRRVTLQVPSTVKPSQSFDSGLAESVSSTPVTSPAVSRKAEAPVPAGVQGPKSAPS